MALLIELGSLAERSTRTQITPIGGKQRRIRTIWRERPGGGAAYLELSELDGTIIGSNRRLSPGPIPCIYDTGNGTNEGSLRVTGPDPYTRDQVGGVDPDVKLWFVKPGELEVPAEDPNLVLTITLGV